MARIQAARHHGNPAAKRGAGDVMSTCQDSRFHVAPGDSLVFRGCCFPAVWEFDAPLIIYSPIQRYCVTGSVAHQSIEQEIENIAIDLCINSDGVLRHFNADDLKEFQWRGWNPNGFKNRKRATHASFKVTFSGPAGDLEFSMTRVG